MPNSGHKIAKNHQETIKIKLITFLINYQIRNEDDVKKFLNKELQNFDFCKLRSKL